MLWALGCLGCGAESAPPIAAPRVVLAYLAEPERVELDAAGAGALAIDLVRPANDATAGGGVLPALQLQPPARVRFDVPAQLPPGARLHVEMCVRHGQYRRTGSVSFRWTQAGETLAELQLPSSAGTPVEERRWHPLELAVGAGRELQLELAYTGSAARPPRVALAELELREPRSVPRARSGRDRPNVVLVVIDTLRADRLGCYGAGGDVSPQLDRIAAAGTLFERAFASAPWTSPATASILSGLSPPGHGVRFGSSVLSPAVETIAEVLQREGFTTAAFSCNNLISRSRNFDQGFELFVDRRWQDTGEIVAEVVDWIEGRRGSRFFLYLHLVDPHDPYEPPEPWAERHASVPPAGYGDLTQPALMERLLGGEAFEPEFLRAVARHNLALYDGEIAAVDDALGRIDRALEALGLAQHTLLCVTSDHGEEFMEHGLMGHVKQLHEESVRVPLLLRGPGVPVGQRVSDDVPNELLAATLLRLAGVEVSEDWGRADLLRRANAPDGEPVFFSTSRGRHRDGEGWSGACRMHGVRAGRWTLIWIPAQGQRGERHELYDRSRDPLALDDVAGEHPRTVRALQEQIEAWLARGAGAAGAAPDARIEVEGRADAELLRALGYIED